MTRFVTTIAAVIFFLTCATLPLYAQWIPKHFSADTSFRVECLFSNHTLSSYDDPFLIKRTYYQTPIDPVTVGFANPIEQLRIDFNNNLPVIDGTVEVTPFPAVSSRLRGSTSIFNSDKTVNLKGGPHPGSDAFYNPAPGVLPDYFGWRELAVAIKPQFYLWEVAGLYNLSYEGFYRYSLVGGYRQESWSYKPADDNGSNAYLRDDFTSQIPFLGMQTVMNAPEWKARFEVLGSPFMTKKVAHSARDGVEYMQLDGNLTQGGFIELQMDGNINVTPNGLMGVCAQYSYEQLQGELTGTSLDGLGTTYRTTSYNFYTLKSIWTLGLSGSILF